MNSHRVAENLGDVKFFILDRSFSLFRYIREELKIPRKYQAIPRCFSVAKSKGARGLIQEEICPCCIIQEENSDLRSIYKDSYSEGVLYRISFWKTPVSPSVEASLKNDDFIGYILLKQDIIENEIFFHVFEAVLSNSAANCFCHFNREFEVRILRQNYRVSGVLYAQQNGITKCCAHVALFSLLSIYPNERNLEPSFAKMNACIQKTKGEKVQSLTPWEIQKILDLYGVSYQQYYPDDIDYHKIAYSGVESGYGTLLAFYSSEKTWKIWLKNKISKLKKIVNLNFSLGLNLNLKGHVIFCWGHLLEQNAWLPQANRLYFNKSHFFSSMNWVSHYLIHDDNFGCNFTLPVNHISKNKLAFCIECRPPKQSLSTSSFIDNMALICFKEIISSFRSAEPDYTKKSFWGRELFQTLDDEQLILRTFAVTKELYLKMLSEAEDADGKKESEEKLEFLSEYLEAGNFWLTEISVPQLFSINERKLADILFCMTSTYDTEVEYQKNCKLIRIPFHYFMINNEKIEFCSSDIAAHIPNISMK